ncbi:MAG: Smr/MutS family protein [Bacilli bacterium]|nr:Smr/MutS family protein [bacterium]MDY3757728.1 Smr/MutS family protein [Bacilli bacterium]
MHKGSPFLNILPSIDVHGFTRETVYVPVSDFINDNIKLRNKKIVIIHGIGYGILRDEINRRFKRDKRVKKLYLSIDNAGCTIIELY